MPHEIETFDDGTAAFFTARTDAWHQLGPSPATASPPSRS